MSPLVNTSDRICTVVVLAIVAADVWTTKDAPFRGWNSAMRKSAVAPVLLAKQNGGGDLHSMMARVNESPRAPVNYSKWISCN